jgi:ABC-type dipeptide/oligopeptide/nickel transport system permease component
LAAWQRRRFVDALVLVSTTVALAIPVFVLASLTRDLLGIRWDLLPASGRDGSWAGYVLPALVLAAPTLALVARLTRASLDAERDAPYLTTIAAQGVPPARRFFTHALRNSWAPIIAFLATDLGALLAGAVVVESVFDLDGLGRALETAITRRDQPVIIGLTLVGVAVYLIANLVADIVVAALDPRVRDA